MAKKNIIAVFELGQRRLFSTKPTLSRSCMQRHLVNGIEIPLYVYVEHVLVPNSQYRNGHRSDKNSATTNKNSF